MSPLKIDYIEFHTAALPETKTFFAKAFGWSFVDYGADYASFEGAGMNGGFSGENGSDGSDSSRSVLVVLKADDLEAAQEQVIAAGGEIVGPIVSFPGGRRFRFREPGGNVLAVWSA